VHDPVQFTTDTSAFNCDLFAGFLTERHHESNEFERFEQAVIVLVVNNDVVIRRQKLLADTRQCLLVKLLPISLQQEELKEVIGQHNKDDLIDNHRKGTGGKMGQIAKAFELSIPFLSRDTQMVLLLSPAWVLNLFRVD